MATRHELPPSWIPQPKLLGTGGCPRRGFLQIQESGWLDSLFPERKQPRTLLSDESLRLRDKTAVYYEIFMPKLEPEIPKFCLTWNSVPENIRTESTLAGFKRLIRTLIRSPFIALSINRYMIST